MTPLEAIVWDYAQCRKEAEELEKLLKANAVLDEQRDILPFFKARKHLSAMCGVYNPYITVPNRICGEFQLFGDFRCDLVVGNWATSYCFIEFEDAGPKSIFVKKRSKSTTEWSPRFEHGYSQIIDWFCKIAERMDSPECEVMFGKRTFDYEGVLVIGRDQHLGLGERLRLDWRKAYLVLDSKKIHCVTFDELLRRILASLDTIALMAAATKATK